MSKYSILIGLCSYISTAYITPKVSVKPATRKCLQRKVLRENKEFQVRKEPGGGSVEMEVGWGWRVVGRRNSGPTQPCPVVKAPGKALWHKPSPALLLPTQIHARSRDPFLLNLLFLRFIFLPKLFKIDVKQSPKSLCTASFSSSTNSKPCPQISAIYTYQSFQIYIFSSDYSPQLQTHISNNLLDSLLEYHSGTSNSACKKLKPLKCLKNINSTCLPRIPLGKIKSSSMFCFKRSVCLELPNY